MERRVFNAFRGWKEFDIAVVVMTNSDNGTVVKEFIRAIAAEYGIPGFEPTVKAAIEVSEAARSKLAGEYQLPNKAKIKIQLSNEGLKVISDFINMTLVAESRDSFFNRKSGFTIQFIQTSERVSCFKHLSTLCRLADLTKCRCQRASALPTNQVFAVLQRGRYTP